MSQYLDNVVGPGARYDDAYFEIPYIRTYTTQAGVVPAAAATAAAQVPTPIPTPTPSGVAASDTDPSAAQVEDPFGSTSNGVRLGLWDRSRGFVQVASALWISLTLLWLV